MTTPRAPSRRSIVLKTHAGVWGSAGLAAALYLGWSYTQPAPMGSTAFKTDRGEVRDRQIATMALAQLSKDMRAVEAKLATQDEAAGAVQGRLAALEEKTAVLAATTAAAPGSGAGTVASGPAVNREAPATGPVPALRPSEITTGAIIQRATSVASGAAASAGTGKPGAAVLVLPDATKVAAIAGDAGATVELPALPKPRHGIQLTSAASLDALRLNWSLLNERHRTTLGPLETLYRQAKGKPNAPYQLIAGPVGSSADAVRICKELTRTGVACRATTFTGEAL